MHLRKFLRMTSQGISYHSTSVKSCEISLINISVYFVYSFRFAKKKKGKQKVLSLQKVNQRREVNYCGFKLHGLYAETVLFSFPLNGRANYICRFKDLIKDAVSSTPG